MLAFGLGACRQAPPPSARQAESVSPPFRLDDHFDSAKVLSLIHISWTFVVERELGKNTTLRASYIGNHGSDLEQRWAWNDAESLYNYRAATGLFGPGGNASNSDLRRFNPNWSGAYGALEHNGYSNTQSIQFEFNHRFSRGLTAQAFYTYAHAMSTTDSGGSSDGDGSLNTNGSGYSPLVPQNNEILGNPNLTLSLIHI